ncbi:MAG: hypothetical protein LBR38_04405 [Synergistaceae bacterium]|jgi:hypothetical protein|nr:hypothetical protein [Synergistaceae bacterium]
METSLYDEKLGRAEEFNKERADEMRGEIKEVKNSLRTSLWAQIAICAAMLAATIGFAMMAMASIRDATAASAALVTAEVSRYADNL